MIDLIFYYGTEIVLVRINGKDIQFSTSSFGNMTTNIEGLKLDKSGVIREFPDLKNNADWREEAIKRFKAHIKELPNEEAISKYIIEDLKKYGYSPRMKQRSGFRPESLA